MYCDEMRWLQMDNQYGMDIIQNAIGGLYESEEICYSNCNNYVSKQIHR